MALIVTIEGTWTPAVGGPGRGERWEVELDTRVQNLLRAGAARIVAENTTQSISDNIPSDPQHENRDPDPDPSSDPDTVPGHNASRARWADYLRSKGVAFPDDRAAFDAGDKTAWANRDDLIIIWQQASGGS